MTGLQVAQGGVYFRGPGMDMPIGDEQVIIGIVVKISKEGAPPKGDERFKGEPAGS